MVTTARHLASRIGADERTLRRAVQQGTIRVIRLSARRIELTATEEQYLRDNWPLLHRLRSALRTEPGVRFAAVFGSTASGDARPDSDIDLLVDLSDASWARSSALTTRLERALDRPVDLVVLEQARHGHRAVLLSAIDHGRVLVDRDAVWPALLEQRPALARAVRDDDARDARAAEAAVAELAAS